MHYLYKISDPCVSSSKEGDVIYTGTLLDCIGEGYILHKQDWVTAYSIFDETGNCVGGYGHKFHTDSP